MILKGSSGSSMPSLASALRGAIHTSRQIPSREPAQQPNAVQCSGAQTTQKRSSPDVCLDFLWSTPSSPEPEWSLRDAEQLEIQMSRIL